VLELFEKISSKYGIFGVLGNSDYTNHRGMCILCHKAGSKELDDTLPIKILRNNHAVIKTAQGDLYVAGVDDPVGGQDAIDETLENIPQDAVVILLAHSPDIVGQVAGKDVDLILCGHTHGGQVNLPITTRLHTGNPLYSRYRSGLFNVGNTFLYVNRGIGTSYLPVRFFCRPEITVFSFEGSH
jgi:predicted MPP superfamily phosphohydrolase